MKGRFSLSSEQAHDYKAAVAEAQELKSVIDTMGQAGEIGQYLDAPAGGSDAAANVGGERGGEVKSLADVFINSREFEAARERGFDVGRISGAFEGKSLHGLSGGTHEMPAFGTPQNVGFTERALRKTRIRDLFPEAHHEGPDPVRRS